MKMPCNAVWASFVWYGQNKMPHTCFGWKSGYCQCKIHIATLFSIKAQINGQHDHRIAKYLMISYNAEIQLLLLCIVGCTKR